MMFYVLHLFVLHTLALLVALVSGQPHEWLGWNGFFPTGSPPEYGYGLPGVYLATVAALAILYYPCLALCAGQGAHAFVVDPVLVNPP